MQAKSNYFAVKLAKEVIGWPTYFKLEDTSGN